MITIKETANGLCFGIYVLPRASKIAIVGCHQDALKIKLTAPPVGGAANKQCIQVLAKALGIPKSAITITSGQKNRRKNICLTPPQTLGPDAINALKSKLEQLAVE